MKLPSLKTAAILSTFLIFFGVFIVNAQELDVVTLEGVNPGDQSTFSCTELQEGIDEKVEMYQTLKPEHTLAYETLALKVEVFSEKAAVMGYDTSELELDLVQLDTLIAAFETNYTAFLAALTNTKTYICLDNDVAYATAVRNTLEALGDVRSSVRDLADFYEEILRPDILSLGKVEDAMEADDATQPIPVVQGARSRR